jgi:transcriptional regulator with XRE-family HTH domain
MLKQKQANKITQADIVRASGISSGQVSVAFSGKGSLSDYQRDRIFAVARELGYEHPLLKQAEMPSAPVNEVTGAFDARSATSEAEVDSPDSQPVVSVSEAEILDVRRKLAQQAQDAAAPDIPGAKEQVGVCDSTPSGVCPAETACPPSNAPTTVVFRAVPQPAVAAKPKQRLASINEVKKELDHFDELLGALGQPEAAVLGTVLDLLAMDASRIRQAVLAIVRGD